MIFREKEIVILRNTDWTMTTGATVDQAQWAAYRQTIRDLPQTYKDKTPDDVVWPTQPSTAGPKFLIKFSKISLCKIEEAYKRFQ